MRTFTLLASLLASACTIDGAQFHAPDVADGDSGSDDGSGSAGSGSGSAGSGSAGSGSDPVMQTIAIRTFADPLDTVAESAAFVAIQDGDGLWQLLEPSATGVYAAQISGDRYGVAIGCGAGANHTVALAMRTVADGTAIDHACDDGVSHTAEATIVPPAGADAVTLVTPRARTVATAADWSVAVSLPAAPTEVIALAPAAGVTHVMRTQTFKLTSDGAQLHFAFPDPYAMASGDITLDGPAQFTTSLVSKTGTYPLASSTAPAYAVLPAALIEAGDLYAIDADTATTHVRGYVAPSATAAPVALELPAPYAASFAIVAATYPRATAMLPRPASALSTSYEVDVAAGAVRWIAEISPGWLPAGADPASFEIGGLDGAEIDTAFFLPQHEGVVATATFVQATSAAPVDGARVLRASTTTDLPDP